MASLLLKNARLVNEDRIRETDILVRDGRIARIDAAIGDDGTARVLDLDGKKVLPGLIDDQVHFREPGLTHKADIASESTAAVAGGITSYMEMPNVDPATTTRERLADKYARARLGSRANYAFYLGATNSNLSEIERLRTGETCGVKVFMGASTGTLLVDDETALARIFERCPTLVATHCEHSPTIERNLAAIRARRGDDLLPRDHPAIRTVEACYLSSRHAVELARRFATRLHVLHLTTAREMSLFDAGPVSGKKITAEVCVHHLYFCDDDYAALGNRIKCNPAIKTAADRAALREAVRDDRIDVIATDHAPHLLSEKEGNYLSAAAGLPLVQHALPMLLEQVASGLFSLEQIVRKTSHAVADAYRMIDRGYVREGYWADLTVIDFASPTDVGLQPLYSKCGWSPFASKRFPGSVFATVVSGQIAWLDNAPVDAARGQPLDFAAQR